MTAVLKAPPAGFEDAVAAHFAAQRDRILQQCWKWTEEAPADMRDKMLGALTALHAALPPSTGDGASSADDNVTDDAAPAPSGAGSSSGAAPSGAGPSGATPSGEGPRIISSSKFRDGVEVSKAAADEGTDDVYD